MTNTIVKIECRDKLFEINRMAIAFDYGVRDWKDLFSDEDCCLDNEKDLFSYRKDLFSHEDNWLDDEKDLFNGKENGRRYGKDLILDEDHCRRRGEDLFGRKYHCLDHGEDLFSHGNHSLRHEKGPSFFLSSIDGPGFDDHACLWILRRDKKSCLTKIVSVYSVTPRYTL